MSSDIETFTCMILNTEYMTNLIFNIGEVVEHIEELDIIYNWERYDTVNDIIAINNKHINKAIKELLKNKSNVEYLKECTSIDIESIKI